jgi:hypothetical protein
MHQPLQVLASEFLWPRPLTWYLVAAPPSIPEPSTFPSVQVQELQGQRQEEAMKAEKWLFECRNLEEKYESVTKEKEVRLESHGPSSALHNLG